MSFYMEKSQTKSTPYVLIDEGASHMKIKGESFDENIVDFFEEVNQWLDSYLKSDFKSLILDCDMQYSNVSTAKTIMNMLINMNERASSGKKIEVNWIAENDAVRQSGEELKSEMKNLNFNVAINYAQELSANLK